MARSGIVERDYLLFFLPGYATLSLFSAVNGVVQGIFNERIGGMLNELLSCPVRVGAYVLAKLVFAASVAVMQTLVLIHGAFLLVPGIVSSDIGTRTVILLPLLFLGAMLISSMIACIMAGITNIRTFIVVANIVNPTLTYASSVFYPIESVPRWLQVLAQINPLTWCVELVRAVLLMEGGILIPLGRVAVGVLILAPAAVVLNRWRILHTT